MQTLDTANGLGHGKKQENSMHFRWLASATKDATPECFQLMKSFKNRILSKAVRMCA